MVGGNDGKVLDKVHALNLKTLAWTKMRPLNFARDELATTLGPDHKIYAVGGYGGPNK